LGEAVTVRMKRKIHPLAIKYSVTYRKSRWQKSLTGKPNQKEVRFVHEILEYV